MIIAALLVALQSPADFGLPPGLYEPGKEGAQIEQVSLAPIFHQPFACSQHPSGQLTATGDALGSDCAIEDGVKPDNSGFSRPFRSNGATNQDWYSWRADVHAPISGRVTAIHINPVTNRPGKMGKPPASMILLTGADGTNVLLAHIDAPRVKVGDAVTAGQVIAQVGNNGMSRAPHIHVGAYRGSTPLQFLWDSRAMGRVQALTGG